MNWLRLCMPAGAFFWLCMPAGAFFGEKLHFCGSACPLGPSLVKNYVFAALHAAGGLFLVKNYVFVLRLAAGAFFS